MHVSRKVRSFNEPFLALATRRLHGLLPLYAAIICQKSLALSARRRARLFNYCYHHACSWLTAWRESNMHLSHVVRGHKCGRPFFQLTIMASPSLLRFIHVECIFFCGGHHVAPFQRIQTASFLSVARSLARPFPRLGLFITA